MINVKKLISGFLILATAAVFSGLIFTYIGNGTGTSRNPSGPTIAGVGGDVQKTVPVFGSSAFVDTGSLQGNAAEILGEMDIPTTTLAAAGDPTNLTNTFAESFLDGFTAANPNGAIIDGDGGTVFNSPDTQAIATALAANPVFENFNAPDWNAEAAKIKIITTNDNSNQSLVDYAEAVNNVYQNYFGNTDIGSILASGDPGQARIVEAQIEEALTSAETIPTPTSLAGLQKSFLKVLVYNKEYAALSAESTTDPLKTALIFQNEQTGFNAALNDFDAQWSKILSLQTTSFLGNTEQNKNLSFLDNLFTIPVAHAQLAVFDAANAHIQWLNLATTLKTYAEDIALQILINTLTNLIQQKVLTAIQGNGTPQFVTDFGTEMVDSFTSAAVNTLGSYMKCVPSYEAPFVQTLLSTPSVANNNICQAEFNGQLSNNLQNYYNNFSNFNDYLKLFQSGGNIWSLTIQTRDAALIAGSNSQQAHQTQLTSNGFKGIAVCDDHSNPSGTTYKCTEGTLDNSTNPPTCNMGSGLIPEQAIVEPNLGKCADGSDPQIKSPIAVTADTFATALKGGLDNITNAKNIAGILNALLSSLLNTIASNAINLSNQELSNLANGNYSTIPSGPYGLTGISSSSLALSGSSSNTATAIQCLPPQQSITFSTSTNQAVVSFSAAGGAIDTTCASSNSCAPGVNTDGTPTYTWSAPGSVQTGSSTPSVGDSFFATYPAIGTYYVTVTASTDHTSAKCEVDVQ